MWRNIMIIRTVLGERLSVTKTRGLRQLGWGGNWWATTENLRSAYRLPGIIKIQCDALYGRRELNVGFSLREFRIGCCRFDEKTFKLIFKTIGARNSKKALAAKAGR